MGKSHYSVGTGDNGPLTPRGVAMLKEFERVGMILDVTHLSDESFFQALERFAGPVMASHNNCRALVPGDRQFSDEQLRLLIGRGAVIGVVCDAWMLTPGWKIGVTRPEQLTMASPGRSYRPHLSVGRQLRTCRIGSDLDGGFGTEQTPGDLKTIAICKSSTPLLAARVFRRRHRPDLPRQLAAVFPSLATGVATSARCPGVAEGTIKGHNECAVSLPVRERFTCRKVASSRTLAFSERIP